MYTQAHQYVTVIGDSYGSTEKWQFGFRLTAGGVSNQATADALKPIIQKWWIGTAAPYSVGVSFKPVSYFRLGEIKVANIDVDGTYPPTLPSASSFIQPPLAGTGNPPAGQSAQQTMAVTLVTALPRGLASKGRMYLPPCANMLPDPTGLVPTANILGIVDSVRIMFTEINADPLIGSVAVFSRGRGVPVDDTLRHRYRYTYPNAGAMQLVTGVRMGRVVDTQRRRRRSLLEVPVSATNPV